MTEPPALIPELAVTNYSRSLTFWRDLLGFMVEYARPHEGFAHLSLGGAHVLLGQITTENDWPTADTTPPLGRGINLEIQVLDVAPMLGRLRAAGWPLLREPAEHWYQAGHEEIGVREFSVQDPDGYLVRLQTELERRPIEG